MSELKVNVRVSNKVIDKGHYYSFECKTYEVKPFKVTRRSCGDVGAAKNRYYYTAHFVGFDDMLDCHKRSLLGVDTHEHIMRKQNPKFNPKKLYWNGNVATVNEMELSNG